MNHVYTMFPASEAGNFISRFLKCFFSVFPIQITITKIIHLNGGHSQNTFGFIYPKKNLK
jgi:hypothetical protein